MALLFLIGLVWTLPNTLLGLLLALLSRPHFWQAPRDYRIPYALEVTMHGGLGAWALRTFGMDAITLGAVVLYRVNAPTHWLRQHERRHTLQALVLGPLYIPMYLFAATIGLVFMGHAHSGNVLEWDADTFAEDQTRNRKVQP